MEDKALKAVSSSLEKKALQKLSSYAWASEGKHLVTKEVLNAIDIVEIQNWLPKETKEILNLFFMRSGEGRWKIMLDTKGSELVFNVVEGLTLNKPKLER